MTTVLLAGGSGLIGQRLSHLLEAKGYQVLFLSRSKKEDDRYFQWDTEKGTIDAAAIEKADYVINLAGAGIADKRWTKARKKILIESRTQSAALLRDSFEKIKKPKAYLSASAIGYYGNRGDEWLEETAAPRPKDFLSKCVMVWEDAAKEMETLNIRTIMLRIGIVLSTQGGALPEMIFPMKLGARVSFGNGEAYYPWVHIEEVCNMFIWALENEKASGVYNAVAPEPVKVKNLMKVIQEVRGGVALPIPAPAFALRLAMGEMADILLNSARVSSEKIAEAGYEFRFRDLEEALADVMEREV